MQRYNPKDIESKWQEYWEKEKIFQVSEDDAKRKFYALVEFPYPSGAGLHVGHPRSYTAMDVIARKRRMEGYNVLYPIGFDSFGLPTENFAIKTGRPPAEITAENIATFTRQLKSLGFSFDWSRAVTTSDPEYYKWTQWIFLQLYKYGLAYKKKQPINWCPKDKIGLANEEVVDGKCERCGGSVEKRDKEQWMLAITKYADKLLEGLNEVDYIERAKLQQENWIGKSEGALISFVIACDTNDANFDANVANHANDANIVRSDSRPEGVSSVEVFTTRPDTLFGATYLVVAPEHEIIINHKFEIINYDEVEKYVNAAKRKTDLERTELQKEKTGVELKGIKAVNPASGEEISVWVADYVLGSYGTGSIMAVPAHDERDFEFAKKYDLPVKEVVAKQLGERLEESTLRYSVRGICVKDEKIPIIHDLATEEYLLPGGGIEKGEDPAAALKREVQEELGYKEAIITQSLGTVEHNYYHHFKKNNWQSICSGFVIELDNKYSGERSIDDQRKAEVLWLPIDEAYEKLKNSKIFSREAEFIDRLRQKFGIPFTEDGITVHSDFLDGLTTKEAKDKMIAWLEEKGIGGRKVQYKLRDWVFSRQRYWGEPIPLVHCESCASKKYTYILLHGRHGSSQNNFLPWLKGQLEEKGHIVHCPDLPNTMDPKVEEQADFVIKNFAIDENTIIIGHSLGGPVALKILEKTGKRVAKVVLVDSPVKPEFNDVRRPDLEKNFDWKFNFKKIRNLSDEFVSLIDANYPIITEEQFNIQKNELGSRPIHRKPNEEHFCSKEEPDILDAAVIPGWIPIPEKELPLKLPEVKNYQPTDTGESPLSAMTDWVNTKCPNCGGPARRETDTMPNWAGSSWYFLRYCDPNNKKEFASMDKLKYWMDGKTIGSELLAMNSGGVDWYNGGMEHTVLHLLYSRFWNQFLYDIGVVPTLEPYKKRTSHGMILASDGQKMSKSLGNVINPDDMVKEYGADALRTYIMFMGPFDQAIAWDTNGLIGVRRFLERVWKLQSKVKIFSDSDDIYELSGLVGLERIVHESIKKVTEDIEDMKFNTAVARLMEFSHALSNAEVIPDNVWKVFLCLLSPFAPHVTEELWSRFGFTESIAFAQWPMFDSEKLVHSKITLAIQINGKLRDVIVVSADVSEDDAKKVALANEKVQKYLGDKEPKKVIYVKGKLVSIVV